MRIKLIASIVNILEYLFNLRVSLYLSSNPDRPLDGDVILDVGANRGSISKIYSRLFPKTRIIAVEPLQVFKAKSMQIELMNIALSEKSGYEDFFLCKHIPSSSLKLLNSESRWYQLKLRILGVSKENIYEKIRIEVSTLDKIIAQKGIERVFLLKIDTEGSEFDILKGGLKSLNNRIIQNIQLESQSNDFRQNNSNEIFEILESYNFVHVKSMKHYFGSITEEFFTLSQI